MFFHSSYFIVLLSTVFTHNLSCSKNHEQGQDQLVKVFWNETLINCIFSFKSNMHLWRPITMFLVWTSTDQCTNNRIKHLHGPNMNCELNFQQSALWYILSLKVESHGSLTGPVVMAILTHAHIYREQRQALEEEYRHRHKYVCSTCDLWQISLSIYSRAEGNNMIPWPFSSAGHSPPHGENSTSVLH